MESATDPALIELVSQRMNLREDEVEALRRGDVAAVIAGRFGNDPRMAPLLHLAENEQAAPQEEAPARKARPEAARAGARADRRKRRGRIRRLVLHLQEELDAAHVVVSHMARVLGACPRCFGEDEDCTHCDGRGRPGSVRPDREELLAWVEPALARLGLRTTPIESHKQQRNQATSEKQGEGI